MNTPFPRSRLARLTLPAVRRAAQQVMFGLAAAWATWAGGLASGQAAQVDHAREPVPGLLTPGAAGPGLQALIQEYSADREGLDRFYDMPWLEKRMERLEQLDRRWLERLNAQDFESLSQEARVDLLLLRNKLSAQLAREELDRQRLGEMAPLLPFRTVIQDLQLARWRMEPVDPQKAAEALSPIPDQIKKLRKRIPKPPAPDAEGNGEAGKENEKEKEPTKPKADAIRVSPSLARRTAAAVEDLRRALRDWTTFYDGYVPEFGWWLRKPQTELQSSLESYSKFLREEIAGLKGQEEDPLVGDPVGEASLAADLAAEMIPYTPQELVAIGEAEFAWCEARMKEAAQEMALGQDWKAALRKVKGNYVAPGRQDGVIAAQARLAIEFIKTNDLVTLPPLAEEIWRLSMLSPEAQKNLPYAAYSGPNMLVAYARDDMKHEDKLMSMRGNNPHFMHIVTPHELIPGHHLQRYMAERNRAYRQLFSTPFLVEGWALYWEMNLWDRHYGATPEDRVGMLFWRMHRAARIIVSLKFHLGQMKPAEMIEFIVDRVGHERMGATSEVRRFIGGGYSPLYQCGYMIGGLQLRALQKEVVASGKMTEKQFNDAVLTQGPIPIDLIRAALLNLPLHPDQKPSWRFAP